MSYFISLEGVEGSGKTTLLKYLHDFLEHKGYSVVSTREPGGIAIAEQIRSIILDKNNTKMDGRTEALLYAAARRQHLVEKIIPALNEGKIVLCDRFIDSSLAYQGYARKLGMDEILSINHFAINDILPNLTIYLDINPKIGLKRIMENKEREVNRLDLEDHAFHQQVYEGYEEVLRRFPNRIVRINAAQEIEKVISEAKLLIMNKLNL